MKFPDEKRRWRSLPWRSIAVVIVALVLLNVLYGQIDIDDLHKFAAGLNGPLVFLGILVLPLLGFPVSVLHVFAGVRWGAQLGISLVVLSILLQLLASYALVRLFRPLFAARLEPLRQRIPEGAHGPVALFTMLVPGVPYFAKNYVLPLIGMPLRVYLLWCFPMHSLRSMVPIVFGDLSNNLTPTRIVALCLYGTAIALACAWAFRRLRAQLEGRPPAAGDPTRSA